MWIVILMLIALSIIASVSLFAASTSVKRKLQSCYVVGTNYLVGDVFPDRKITVSDVQVILRYVAKLPVPDRQLVEIRGDVNADGKITPKDSNVLLQYIAGKISILPRCAQKTNSL